jgi:hypothetical protein
VLAGAAQGGWKSALPSAVKDQGATALSSLLASDSRLSPKREGERLTLFLPEVLTHDERTLLLALKDTSERREYIKRHTLKRAQTIQSLGALPKGTMDSGWGAAGAERS